MEVHLNGEGVSFSTLSLGQFSGNLWFKTEAALISPVCSYWGNQGGTRGNSRRSSPDTGLTFEEHKTNYDVYDPHYLLCRIFLLRIKVCINVGIGSGDQANHLSSFGSGPQNVLGANL
ncbi:hypothetical protein HAX54_052800 [Datura stramonium]|uniref:Uncharacterized protein n=1 Tax=Datura stramonium TaxID=4076 RepID=A0ABS8WNV2_DATST|nr:hypothetical protein [Datura stramonium]